ncbi:cytochrome c biogenesis CcdA family protein [Lysobacter solisilvae (ex Woo and Kim 2020)]|uniref:Cytochrome c biogenesis protein CcdA n=1 Tax=Agrilutibacter terrestris TaxID=2865112 RepID=A0A7H0FXL4_9GAMM|nr:cytochrome c biogenesis CcdA family protein [Lysobacter terrestris]QNP40780.1 cytochrome c biogenesis protein CcdA [Lysobacter terrestris]
MLDYALAAVAGIATIASPCILPVLPIVLATTAGRSRIEPLLIIIGFVLSFALGGILIGAMASSSGEAQQAIRTASIVVLLVAGLGCVWATPFEWLAARTQHLLAVLRPNRAPSRLPQGKANALIVGASLGVAWTPCAGPVLTAVLALAASAQAPGEATALLGLYALGAGVPMLAIAYGGHWVSSRLSFFNRRADLFRKVFGVVAIGVAALQLLHCDTTLIAWATQWLPVISTGL